MSRGYQMKNLARTRGYYAISKKQGINSFLVGLHHDRELLLVGLDGGNRHIRRHAEAGSLRLRKLSAYFTSHANQVTADKFQELLVRDRFGTRCTCDFRQIPGMPLTDTGEIDRENLASTGRNASRSKTEWVAPKTQLERTIASIWQEVLHTEKIEVHANFFDLGGNSLLMAQVNGKLQNILKSNLSKTEMFQFPTISSLARHLDEGQNGQLPGKFKRSQSRGGIRRKKMQTQRKRRSSKNL